MHPHAAPMPQHPPGIFPQPVATEKPKKPAYAIPRKNTEKLFELDGDGKSCMNWRDRMLDHMTEEWPHWRRIIDAVEGFKHPISWNQVQATTVDTFNGTELALDLWSFLSRWIGKRLYDRRKKMGVAIEGNGFELWRKLFYDYRGSSELIALAGRKKLLAFPQCRDKKN